MGEGDTYINALIGAVVTVVLSFTGFSPLLGGGVAGYLQRGERSDGIRVGAISGAIATIPFLFVFSVFGSFIFTGSMMGPGLGVAGATVLVFVFGFVFALFWSVALSAAGGYLGVYLATETDLGN
jgi:hypothetical protein